MVNQALIRPASPATFSPREKGCAPAKGCVNIVARIAGEDGRLQRLSFPIPHTLLRVRAP